MTTACFTDPRTNAHNLPDHPEHAGRLQAIEALFQQTGMADRLRCLTPDPATEDQILTVHRPEYLTLLAAVERDRRFTMYGGDTYLTPASYQAARLSVGAALGAVDAVLRGEAANALVAMRPPGHHALPDRPMGFCLLANAALAARHAQLVHGVGRILIVDYDLHHGNGTQDIFYDDPDVLFISSHQSPYYPGTGYVDEIGYGAGAGATINMPLPAGHGDASYARLYEAVVWPAATRFRPELILVSAGFDCHWGDPLGGMRLTLACYDHLARELIRMAGALCAGRIVFILEGGYNLQALSYGLLNVAGALLGDPPGAIDPLPMPASLARQVRSPAGLDPLLADLRRLHHL